MSTEFRTNTIASANELGYQLHDGINPRNRNNALPVDPFAIIQLCILYIIEVHDLNLSEKTKPTIELNEFLQLLILDWAQNMWKTNCPRNMGCQSALGIFWGHLLWDTNS